MPRKRCAIASFTKTSGRARNSKRRGGAGISIGSTKAAITCWCSTTAAGRGPEIVVGTYRLIRREAAARLGGFYSAAEYDIAPLVAYRGEILELGRSCVDAAYRQRPAMQLLWSGIAAYVFHYDIALMFGCASLPGTDPDGAGHAAFLSPSPSPRTPGPARAGARRPLCRDVPAAARRARSCARARRLPPLIKGYLRLGGVCRRRRGDRPRVQHHGCVHRGQDRPRQRKVLAPLRTPGERHQGTLGQSQHGRLDGMGSPALRIARLALYLVWTLEPDAGAGGGSGPAPPLVAQRSRRFITAGAAGCSGFASAWSARRPPRGRRCSPSNHVSYTDITVLGSLIAGSFIAKAEVAGWPLFGWLAKLQRTVFVDRRVRSTRSQRDAMTERLAVGDALILFPEGTSSDGNRVLPFKSALFSAAEKMQRSRRSRSSRCRSPIPGSTAFRSAGCCVRFLPGMEPPNWRLICGA